MIARRTRWFLLLVVVLLALAEATAAAQERAAQAIQEPVELEGRVVTLEAADGAVLLQTGLAVHPGDRFLAADNRWWRVEQVQGDRAVAVPAGRVWRAAWRPAQALRSGVGLPRSVTALAPSTGPAEAEADVVIYHTHSDESYLPSDGTASTEGRGGIFQVGASLAAAVEAAGLKAAQRLEDHYPHDSSAYVRSRRTAMAALSEQKPAVILDVHRDAGPAGPYRFTAGDEAASRILMVIGGSNPARESNLAFATLLKKRADQVIPGLVKGIYVSRGVFNQDLAPRALLLEVGTEHTPRAAAERGVALLGGPLTDLLHELAIPESPAVKAENRAAWRTVLWLVAALAVMIPGWLVLVHGGWRPALEHVDQWRRGLRSPLRRR